MNPFLKTYNEIRDVLQESIERIKLIDAGEASALKSKIIQDLQRDVNFLNAQSGQTAPVVVSTNLPRKFRPLTKMFGTEIIRTQKVSKNDAVSFEELNKIREETAQDVRLAEFKDKIQELAQNFLTIETDSIIDSYSDIEIRGVAKKYAELPVTDNSPKKITTKFIEQIKDALRTKAKAEEELNKTNEINDKQ